MAALVNWSASPETDHLFEGSHSSCKATIPMRQPTNALGVMCPQEVDPHMKPPHRIALSAALAVAVLAIVPSALAAKGGAAKSGSDPSLTVVVIGSTAGAAATQPRWGQQVTFDVTMNATPTWSSVGIDCAQNGASVYRQSLPYPFGNLTFTLSGYWWTGGAADCAATLSVEGNNGRWTTLATTSFHVNA